ncbi:sensor histidine kinase CssS [Lachnospiraceae bacterium]|nr:sensor histidine kinase CssS [Lachnospiraceae bacterium]
MDKIIGYLRYQSIRKSFFIIVFIMAIIVIMLSVGTVGICTRIHDNILLSKAFVINPVEINPSNDGTFKVSGSIVEENESDTYTDREMMICRITEVMIIICPLLFSFLGIWCAGSIFYHIKLKKPLLLLNQGISHISLNDLEFSFDYQESDELGCLCSAFEKMREQLLENNVQMWNMIEERRQINASVAHDLRTPITIIKGYSEYLERNLVKGVMAQDNILDIVIYMKQAANRLEDYANSVHDVQMLEDINLEYADVELIDLYNEIKSSLEIIEQELGKQIKVINNLPNISVYLSSTAVFRILENIVRNACRYCENLVLVEISLIDQNLIITTTDDGKGFTEQDLKKALNPFYKDKGQRDHYGIGLTICKVLSQKHGGDIFLSNVQNSGAKVTVKIKVK